MAYILGIDRLQTGLFCLEDFIAPDAPVRVIFYAVVGATTAQRLREHQQRNKK